MAEKPPVEFDPTLHAPARLKIAIALASGVTSFHELGKLADLTDGNLAAHLRSLEHAGYVESARRLVDLKPRVRYHLTDRGHEALRAYCAALEAAVRGIQRVVPSTPERGTDPG